MTAEQHAYVRRCDGCGALVAADEAATLTLPGDPAQLLFHARPACVGEWARRAEDEARSDPQVGVW